MIFRKPSLARCLTTYGRRAALQPNPSKIKPSTDVPSPSDNPFAPGATTLSTRLRGMVKSEGTKSHIVRRSKATPSGEGNTKLSPRLPKRRFAEADAAKQLGILGAKVSGVGKPEPWSGSWGEKQSHPKRRKSKKTTQPPPSRPAPPHIQPPRNHLSYSRRVEGLLDPSDRQRLQDLTPTSDHRPIAKLAHGLDRVLFNPGVHWLRDPRSRVYNFPPYLEHIPKVTDFAFDRLSGFIKSSRDEDLWELAKCEKRGFAGSTSSLTGMLSQIYFLISGDRNVDVSTLSRSFARQSTNFTPGQRMPASVVMNHNDGVYAIDSDAEKNIGAEKNILTWMGTLLEKYLTMTPEEFTSYMRSAPPPSEMEGEPMREAYRYAKSDRFVMRSQLDCHDSRLPGTGVFDIKTRACLPIRLDLLNFEENSGYLIRRQHGPMESFEKEYYDLVRSAFLKYSFQVRIGNMDGVIVAYHNTERMFGFQYIPLEEMDRQLFGSGPGAGDRVFERCVRVMELVADEIIRCFPKESVKCTFETEEGKGVMNVWVEPTVWESSKERPIKQLEVKVTSYLDNHPVKGSAAVADVDSPWTLHWSISRLSGRNIDVREGLAAAQGRQFRAYNIPTGVDVEDMANFWDNLNFSGKSTPDGEKPPYKPESFRNASSSIRSLRAVARAGRDETKRLEEADDGKPKVVLGQPESVPSSVMQAWLDTAAQARLSRSESSGIIEALVREHRAKQESMEASGDVNALNEADQDAAAVPPPSATESSQFIKAVSSNPEADTAEATEQKGETSPNAY